jgi:hypothetical protein
MRQDTRNGLLEQALMLGAYLLSALALTWPLARGFTTHLTGHVIYDMRHALWIQWYVKEALLGHVTWPETKLLHYPFGISTLVDGVGPLNGLVALPFWPWGPAAAFNGAALVGVTLSGWCLYLLARHVHLDRASAFFAGLLFMASPIHLAGLYGHLEKLFVGLLPLALLAGLLAFDLKRRWTILLPGPVLLAALLQNANQFTFAALGLAVLALVQIARAPRDLRLAQVGRAALVAAVSLAICVPALELIAKSAYHPLMLVDLSGLSPYYAPDLLQFIVPSIDQIVPGRWFYVDRTFGFDSTLFSVFPSLRGSPTWYGSGIETAVAIPITALLLGVAAAFLIGERETRREARRWLVLGAVFVLLALGPILRVAGYTTFTPWQTHITLPQAWLSLLPGFNVMRTPGRFMMMGSVGFAMAAGAGLMAIGRSAGRHRAWVMLTIAAVAMIECWPAPWPQHALPPVPAFYTQIAADRETYGVLDLPAGWPGLNNFSSAYHYYQMTHRKPIAWSYLSRGYVRFPLHGLDALWNRAVTDYAATRDRLARLGYRYVVWHKHAEALFSTQRAEASPDDTTAPGDALVAQTEPFLREAFSGERPVYDDALVTVYRISRVP